MKCLNPWPLNRELFSISSVPNVLNGTTVPLRASSGWLAIFIDIYINYPNPLCCLQIQSYWTNVLINKNLEVWFMAISSAVEVYTILQRHLDTLPIIFIMCLKKQCVNSGPSNLDTEWAVWFISFWLTKNLSYQKDAHPRVYSANRVSIFSQSYHAVKRGAKKCSGARLEVLCSLSVIRVLWSVLTAAWLQGSHRRFETG